MKVGQLILRCGDHEFAMVLSVRDVHLLDEPYFFTRDNAYRKALGLDFVKGLGGKPEGEVLASHPRAILISLLKGLLTELENQRELIAAEYEYEFSDRPGQRGRGATAGFRVNGLLGSVTTHPSGYCTLTLSTLGTAGRGLIVQITDLRQFKEIQTDDRGLMKVYSRKAEVGWFDMLPAALDWLKEQDSAKVDILHT